jgi:hypothetical protein
MNDPAGSLWSLWEWVMALFGPNGLTITVVVAGANGIFTWLVKRNLEAYKTKHSKELELLRHKINDVSDHTKRVRDIEFEALPVLLGKLKDAHKSATFYISPPQIELARVERIIEGWDAKGQKQRRAIESQQRYQGAARCYCEYENCLTNDGAIVKREIKADMEVMEILIREAINEKKLCEDSNSLPPNVGHLARFEAEAPDLMKKIDKAVAEHLRNPTTLED